MKIAQLLEYQFPKIQTVNVQKHRHPGQDQGRLMGRGRGEAGEPIGGAKFMGSGHFSAAWKDEKRSPHDVRKISEPKPPEQVDGFYFYVKALAEHYDNTNPYFPRFRDIKVYQDEDAAVQTITYSANMEHLYKIENLNTSETNSIVARLFGTTPHKGVIDRLQNMLTGTGPWNSPFVQIVQRAIDWAYGVSDDTEDEFLKFIVDEDFKNAITFLVETAEEYSLHVDIHWSNIMYRKTPFGSQLVFSDPFSFQKGDPMA